MFRPTVAEIDLSAIAHNLRVLREQVGPRVEIIGVVKADGYGHGAIPVTRTLQAGGVRRFAVALVEEALELREAGIGEPILVLGAPVPEQAEAIAENRLEATVSDMPLAQRLDEAARRRDRRVGVHVKFDVGMGRLGFPPEHALEVVSDLIALGGLRIAGIMTHFPVADERAMARVTAEQIARFHGLRQGLHAAGIRAPIFHCANSGAILLHPESHMDAVRPGIALYGGFPPSQTPEGVFLRQPMTLKTRAAQVRDVPAGATISYGCTFRTLRPSRIAVLPIGYADGFHRHNSNRGCVLIRGRRAPIIGRVCMDLTMADVTVVPGVAAGDDAVLYGRQGDEEIRITAVAESLGTVPHELMTGLTRRVPRRYVNP